MTSMSGTEHFVQTESDTEASGKEANESDDGKHRQLGNLKIKLVNRPGTNVAKVYTPDAEVRHSSDENTEHPAPKRRSRENPDRDNENSLKRDTKLLMINP